MLVRDLQARERHFEVCLVVRVGFLVKLRRLAEVTTYADGSLLSTAPLTNDFKSDRLGRWADSIADEIAAAVQSPDTGA